MYFFDHVLRSFAHFPVNSSYIFTDYTQGEKLQTDASKRNRKQGSACSRFVLYSSVCNFALGVIGEYIGRIYREVRKDRSM